MAVGAAVGATGVGLIKLADKGMDTYRAVKVARAAVQESGDRFFKKAPKGSIGFKTEKAGHGATKFTYETPGRVPGSKAVYEKVVDRTGEAIPVTKTTIDPTGKVVHVKEKLVRVVATETRPK